MKSINLIDLGAFTFNKFWNETDLNHRCLINLLTDLWIVNLVIAIKSIDVFNYIALKLMLDSKLHLIIHL